MDEVSATRRMARAMVDMRGADAGGGAGEEERQRVQDDDRQAGR